MIRPATFDGRGGRGGGTGGRGGLGGRGRRRGPFGLGPAVPVGVLVVVIAVGVAAYLVLGARASRAAESDVVTHYVQAWGKQDFAAMYDDVDGASRDRLDAKRFATINRQALDTATATAVVPGKISREDQTFSVPVVVRTRLFGDLRATVRMSLTGKGKAARVRWSRRLSLPGLRAGETLTRTTELPARGTILARDGKTTLASGPDRTSSVPNIASQVVGAVGAAKPEDASLLKRLGVPADAKVGISGLERILNPQLVGKPGGTLKAGDRVLKRVAPQKAPDVRSSISVATVKAAAEAQAGAPDATGTMVIDSRTGEVLGFQGSAWTALQPPGSTMKIVTASAALEDGVAKTTTVYPKETEAKGFNIQNSDQELCGGTLVESFAHSCNSVFAPLAVKLGAKRFVDMAEKFGFNETPDVPGALASKIPEASTIGVGDLAQSGIGQAKVEATALQVALMTATIANGGREPELTFLQSSKPAKTRRVVSATTAAHMRQLMLAVVAYGTGTSARVSGVTTAGKTGTAELQATQGDACDQQDQSDQPDEIANSPEPPPSACGNADGKATTAWMSAFAPASRTGGKDPIAVGVLRARNFQGGATAAPVAQKVLTAALGG